MKGAINYRYLEAELMKSGMTRKDVSKWISKSIDCVNDRFSDRNDWKLKECKIIKKNLDPRLSIDVLFQTRGDLA